MTDQNNPVCPRPWRNAAAGRRTPDLTHTASRRLDGIGGNRLYRIDHHQFRLHLLDVTENVFKRCVTHNVAVVAEPPYAVGPHLKLTRALLARHVKDALAAYRQNVL